MANSQAQIQVGPSHQARLPALLTDSKWDERTDSDSLETLVWHPETILDCDLLMFLRAARSMAAFVGWCDGGSTDDGCAAASMDETTINALLMLHEHEYDTGRALQSLVKIINPKSVDKRWSDDDAKKFVRGLKQHGKNFFKIRRDLLPYKETAQLVEYYYLWKKTPMASNTRPHRRHRRPVLRRQAPTPTQPPCEDLEDMSSASEASENDSEDDLEQSQGTIYVCIVCSITKSRRWYETGKGIMCANCHMNSQQPVATEEDTGASGIEEDSEAPPFMFRPVKENDQFYADVPLPLNSVVKGGEEMELMEIGTGENKEDNNPSPDNASSCSSGSVAKELAAEKSVKLEMKIEGKDENINERKDVKSEEDNKLPQFMESKDTRWAPFSRQFFTVDSKSEDGKFLHSNSKFPDNIVEIKPEEKDSEKVKLEPRWSEGSDNDRRNVPPPLIGSIKNGEPITNKASSISHNSSNLLMHPPPLISAPTSFIMPPPPLVANSYRLQNSPINFAKSEEKFGLVSKGGNMSPVLSDDSDIEIGEAIEPPGPPLPSNDHVYSSKNTILIRRWNRGQNSCSRCDFEYMPTKNATFILNKDKKLSSGGTSSTNNSSSSHTSKTHHHSQNSHQSSKSVHNGSGLSNSNATSVVRDGRKVESRREEDKKKTTSPSSNRSSDAQITSTLMASHHLNPFAAGAERLTPRGGQYPIGHDPTPALSQLSAYARPHISGSSRDMQRCLPYMQSGGQPVPPSNLEAYFRMPGVFPPPPGSREALELESNSKHAWERDIRERELRELEFIEKMKQEMDLKNVAAGFERLPHALSGAGLLDPMWLDIQRRMAAAAVGGPGSLNLPAGVPQPSHLTGLYSGLNAELMQRERDKIERIEMARSNQELAAAAAARDGALMQRYVNNPIELQRQIAAYYSSKAHESEFARLMEGSHLVYHFAKADPLAAAGQGTSNNMSQNPHMVPPNQVHAMPQNHPYYTLAARENERMYMELLSRPPYNSDPLLAQQLSQQAVAQQEALQREIFQREFSSSIMH